MENKLYFAGEAYHPCIWACLPGALETSEMATHWILYDDGILKENKLYEAYE